MRCAGASRLAHRDDGSKNAEPSHHRFAQRAPRPALARVDSTVTEMCRHSRLISSSACGTVDGLGRDAAAGEAGLRLNSAVDRTRQPRALAWNGARARGVNVAVPPFCDEAPSLGRGVESPARLPCSGLSKPDPEVESLVPIIRSAEGVRRGREEASEVACPDQEEGASQAQAPKEDLARQVGRGRCASAWRMPPCSATSATTCRCRARRL